jgi:hypothetical protein
MYNFFTFKTKSFGLFPNKSGDTREKTASNDASNSFFHGKPTTDSSVGIISAWGPEIASIGCSAFSLAALVVLLLLEDGKALRSWEFFLPINSMVAILSIAIKAPLAFLIGECLGQMKWSWFVKQRDSLSGFVAFIDASNGPLGNLTLLYWLRFW